MKIILLWVSLLLAIFLYSACSNICENKVLNVIESPSRQYIAYSFIRNCGATTDFSPQVTIIKKSFWGKYPELKNNSGNVFIGSESRDIIIEWIGENSLLVTHNCDNENIFKNEKSIDNVTVIYKKLKAKR